MNRALGGAVVSIGPMIYGVQVVEGLTDNEGRKLLGVADPAKLLILLDQEQKPDSAWSALIHEILHIILAQAGHLEAAEDEGLIRALGHGLLGVWFDGERLVRIEVGDG